MTPPGSYGPALLAVLARADLTPADKLVYTVLLDHLRGSATWVNPGQERLSAMTALTVRGVRLATRRLEEKGLIECRQQTARTPMYAFAPVVGSRDGEDGDEPAPARDVGPRGDIGGSDAPTDAPTDDPPRSRRPGAPGPSLGAPGDSGETGGPGNLGVLGDSAATEAGQDADRGGRNNVPGGRNDFPPRRNDFPPRGGTVFRQSTIRRNNNSAALGMRLAVMRGGETAESEETSQSPQRPNGRDVVDVAIDWQEMLGLDRQSRSEAKDAGDFQALISVAEDMAAGRLGLPGSAASNLATLAHQIGHRDQPAKSPLGMFLAEVGRMRIRACRRPP